MHSNRRKIPLTILLAFSICCAYALSCTHQQVSFKQDVSPILSESCSECHTAPDGFGYKKTGLDMHSYDGLMQGTIYGPVIIAGDSRRSIINKLIEGRAGQMQELMHENGIENISQQEIEVIRIWVDDGALDN